MQKYSSGRRGAPAKGIGRETGARVQIPPSAFYFETWNCFLFFLKKLLTETINYDILSKLSRETTKTQNLDNWTVNNLERFEKLEKNLKVLKRFELLLAEERKDFQKLVFGESRTSSELVREMKLFSLVNSLI